MAGLAIRLTMVHQVITAEDEVLIMWVLLRTVFVYRDWQHVLTLSCKQCSHVIAWTSTVLTLPYTKFNTYTMHVTSFECIVGHENHTNNRDAIMWRCYLWCVHDLVFHSCLECHKTFPFTVGKTTCTLDNYYFPLMWQRLIHTAVGQEIGLSHRRAWEYGRWIQASKQD